MILVTGGTGLVGAHLLLQLAGSGQKVRALYRSEESLKPEHDFILHVLTLLYLKTLNGLKEI